MQNPPPLIGYLVSSLDATDPPTPNHFYIDEFRAHANLDGRKIAGLDKSHIVPIHAKEAQAVIRAYTKEYPTPDSGEAKSLLGDDWYEGLGIDAYWHANQMLDQWVLKSKKTRTTEQLRERLEGLGLIESIQVLLDYADSTQG